MKKKEHSERFEELKIKFNSGQLKESTLWKWVQVNNRRPGDGITESEYDEIIRSN